MTCTTARAAADCERLRLTPDVGLGRRLIPTSWYELPDAGQFISGGGRARRGQAVTYADDDAARRQRCVITDNKHRPHTTSLTNIARKFTRHSCGCIRCCLSFKRSSRQRVQLHSINTMHKFLLFMSHLVCKFLGFELTVAIRRITLLGRLSGKTGIRFRTLCLLLNTFRFNAMQLFVLQRL